MGEEMLLVALGCDRVSGVLDMAGKHPFVVFGTMQGEALAHLNYAGADHAGPALPVYFYETG